MTASGAVLPRPTAAGPGFWRRVGAVARKEWLHLSRDRVLSRIVVLMPVIMLIMFGYALNSTIPNIPLATLDSSNDRVSAALERAFTADERFSILKAASLDEANAAVRSGAARGVLVIPAGAQAALRAGQAVKFSVLVDGSDPTVSSQVRAGASAAVQDFSKQVLAGRALAGGGFSPPASVTMTTLYNPDNRTAVYMVPGLTGLILTFITIMLTSIAIVREREIGTMEALIATPVRPTEVVLGKVLPYLAVGVFDAALVLVVGVLVFAVPMVGSLWLLAAGMALFVLGSLGVGIVISTVAASQIQAMFGTIAYLLPSVFLSGMIFPLEGMSPF
ncbi:MAG TPA: ABC transporter permease, partial [Deinococcales bacterium]|nr:ABC transporter permease [Deinococcales bacterium]